MKRLMLTAALLSMLGQPKPARAQSCQTYHITGYVRGHHSALTFDGTSVWTRERIAAASWNVPMGAYVQVVGGAGAGTYRVADRGNLGARAIDILVDSVSEAYELTDDRTVCVYV